MENVELFSKFFTIELNSKFATSPMSFSLYLEGVIRPTLPCEIIQNNENGKIITYLTQ